MNFVPRDGCLVRREPVVQPATFQSYKEGFDA